jgi:uncharacterized protein with HEPN domain
MSRSDEERVQDILEIAVSLQILVEKGEEFFLADITHQWGIERALQNIGEACTKMSDSIKLKYSDVDWKSIIGMRTYLAHAYHRIDSDIVWKAASISVPALVKALAKTS